MGGDGGWVCNGKEQKRMDPWCGETVGQDSLAGQLQEIEANKESRETFRHCGLRQEKLWEFIMESIEHPVGSYIIKSGHESLHEIPQEPNYVYLTTVTTTQQKIWTYTCSLNNLIIKTTVS